VLCVVLRPCIRQGRRIWLAPRYGSVASPNRALVPSARTLQITCLTASGMRGWNRVFLVLEFKIEIFVFFKFPRQGAFGSRAADLSIVSLFPFGAGRRFFAPAILLHSPRYFL